jgi:hypothetical protein
VPIGEIATFEELAEYLRGFVNAHGDPAPYDFNGAFHLFLSLLDNLSQHHLDADLEDLSDSAFSFTDRQKAFLDKLRTLEREAENRPNKA